MTADNPNLGDEILTVAEAAALLKVPKTWIYERTRENRIPHYRMGPRAIRFSRNGLLAWAQEHLVDVDAATAEPVPAA